MSTIYRHDYTPYPYAVDSVDLHFDLHPDRTVVTSTLRMQPLADGPVVLQGEDIQLVHLELNGQPFSDYQLNDSTLTLPAQSQPFTLRMTSTCQPNANSTLMGLYTSGNSLFTQCEAEGFRRITFFPDRPDVMSEYTVTLEADKARYPQLLSNGNLLRTQDLPEGRHQAVWHDPFRKPCYLFALVAGQFEVREKTVTTASGRSVLLQVYSDPGQGDKTLWALDSLHRAMQWDEQRFGLELDLDRFMIVVTHDFNMGAMENKGLNIFNAVYVLADPDTATDANYEGVESVVGHEYFHNWTGNRVTCRDWFQLSLKEGLTVFRDQEFSADMMARQQADKASARAVKRIADVSVLRASQFPEDAGPMAHPIRPNSYEEIGNFYTATVYEKGAEVIRMQHTLLGEAGFRAGMDEYFRRHDGQAVTCDDFVDAMQSVYSQRNPGKDLSQFRRWYEQAGTPQVQVQLDYDAVRRQASLTLRQSCAPVGVEKRQAKEKLPLYIPFHVGLLDEQGRSLPLHVQGDAQPQAHEGVLLAFNQAEQTWVFNDIPSHPIPSLLRDFSAPVQVHYPYTDAELAVLCAHDPNPFARWEAMQTWNTRVLLQLCQAFAQGQHGEVPDALLHTWQQLAEHTGLDPAYQAWLLTLPSEKVVQSLLPEVHPQALVQARRLLRQRIAQQLAPQWAALYQQHHVQRPYAPDPVHMGQRSLKNLCLQYLLVAEHPQATQWAHTQYEQANNMTDRMGALSALVPYGPAAVAKACLDDFYRRFEDNPLVLDKWFSLQAANVPTVQAVQALLAHPKFSLRNPNRARAVLYAFCQQNTAAFHQEEGYAFWADHVLALDAINPEVAARFARSLDNWRSYAMPYREAMQAQLTRVASQANLSPNTAEIVGKALTM